MEMSGLTTSCTPRLPPCNVKVDARSDVVRPLAHYHPSIWGDYFIRSVAVPDQKRQEWMQHRVEKLKDEVRHMFVRNVRDHHLVKEMNLVDALQRLGLAYHFEKEISEALARIHDAQLDSEDLHVVSLRFRLLRQEGYNISSDDFNKFKDADGQFQSSLGSNVKGLLSLYDAAYVGTHADAVLEEAITFCKHQLQHKMDHLESHLAVEVARALETPLIRRMRRLEARKFITFYEALNEAQNDLILELAKLDFSLLQSLHQDEIGNLSVWWKELGLIQSLNFARDRIVECYFWILGVYYEPCFSRARRMMTKVIALLSILDDIYDSYGTLEELELLTNAIHRWDINSEENLPQYMKVYLVALTETYDEFEAELVGEGRSYRLNYFKEELKIVSVAYLEEAKWRSEGYMPTFEEHLRVSAISTDYKILTCASFLGMGDMATKETFDWLKSSPKIVKASATICRLMDDIVSHEFEQKRDHVTSTVQSYMKEYGVSNEKACQRLQEMINDAWKVMNEECLRPTTIPLQLLMPTFNLSRVMETYYKYSDGYTESFSTTKDLISTLLVECI